MTDRDDPWERRAITIETENHDWKRLADDFSWGQRVFLDLFHAHKDNGQTEVSDHCHNMHKIMHTLSCLAYSVPRDRPLGDVHDLSRLVTIRRTPLPRYPDSPAVPTFAALKPVIERLGEIGEGR